MLTVYKASAGSGKTFQLVAEYLKLLLKNPMNYRQILAVTFTNKATNEMKSRILRQLYLMAGNKHSDVMEVIQKETSIPENAIRRKARQVLKNILHDYNRFSISTIDSFTQRVIKAFQREIGISPRFSLELNDDLLLEEATDRLLARVDQDSQLRRWLVQFSEEKIRENKSQRIEKDIKSLGKELFKEKFQLLFPENDAATYSRENLKLFRLELNKIIASYESTMKEKAAVGVRQMRAGGLDVNDFSGKGRGIGAFFVKMAEGQQPNFTKTTEACAGDPEKWYPKKSPKKEQIHNLTEEKLRPLLQDIIAFKNENETTYFSALEIRKQLRMLGILTDLKEEIGKLRYEKGVLQLSGSNLLLNKIIGESDSPFIYEKIGNQFRHFMLDEFQDTSSLQWNNFKPLVANSLSEGYANLIVGDVKQSVYRWRNSDWNILANQIHTDFPHSRIKEKELDKNWRSSHNIIHFNNFAIEALKKTFEKFLLQEVESDSFKNSFEAIYNHFKQTPGKIKNKNKGLIKIHFGEAEGFIEHSNHLLVEQVKHLQDKGFKAGEIAILIRKNREGTKIIESFLAESKKKENTRYNLSVLSSESLFLHSSRGVNFVILMIEWMIEPDNKITQTALMHLWLEWLKPELVKKAIPGFNKETLPETSGPEICKHNTDIEPFFDKELETIIHHIKEKVMFVPPDEAIMRICAESGLFHITSEWPFLQTLIDQTAEINTSLPNDLSNLLHWWKETGIKTSVQINEEVDAVRLLTVHKAKGLEFEAVLIPDFNWEISWKGNQAPILWCQPEKAPFNRFPVLPVKAGSTLAKTFFKEDYFQEKVNSFIDTLNLIYVAFTRAKSVLIVNAKNPEEKKKPEKEGGPGKSVNSLLKYALESENNETFSVCWNKEKTIFSFGEMPEFDSREKTPESIRIKKYHFSEFSNRIRLRLNSEDFLIYGESRQSVKNTGKVIHEILSEIITHHDIDAACNRAQKEGKINPAEALFIRKKLEESLAKPLIKNWFNGSYTVITEREIISPDKIMRPDRIMISGKRAVVVDYKWGEKIPEKYNNQVRKYAKNLREAGFEGVEGYIWYINQNEVEKI